MVCIYCGGTTHVINSRPQKRNNSIWRRRNCEHCKATVTTTEYISLESALIVKDGSDAIPFNRDELFLSIADSLRHHSDPATLATELTSTVIQTLLTNVKNAAIEQSDVINVSADILYRFDPAAGTHYRAFHKAK